MKLLLLRYIDEIRVVFHKAEAEVMLYLEAIDPGRPVPAELLQRFHDREPGQADAILGGPVTPYVSLVGGLQVVQSGADSVVRVNPNGDVTGSGAFDVFVLQGVTTTLDQLAANGSVIT